MLYVIVQQISLHHQSPAMVPFENMLSLSQLSISLTMTCTPQLRACLMQHLKNLVFLKHRFFKMQLLQNAALSFIKAFEILFQTAIFFFSKSVLKSAF